jgi:hypothetical protein
MGLETIGIVAELIAAAAVVISLIYLAAQVKGSNNQSIAGMTFSLTDDFNRIQEITISSPAVNALLTKLRMNESLEEPEITLLKSVATRYLTHWLAVQTAYDRSLLEDVIYIANCEDVERMSKLYPAMHEEFREVTSHYSLPTTMRILQPIFR